MKTEIQAKLLPLIASIVLLFSWAVQQFLFGEWNATLSKIDASESIFHSYRSSNAVIKSLVILSPPELKDRIEAEQLENYRRGTLEISKTINQERLNLSKQRGIETLPDDIQYESLGSNAKILLELEAIQRVLAFERESLFAKKKIAEQSFLILYILSAVITIYGAVLGLRTVLSQRVDVDA